MEIEHVDARYLAVYASCEQYIVRELGISTQVLRSFVTELFQTPNLKIYYKELCNQAVGYDDPIAISDAKEFIHIIDHFDEMFHEEKRDKTGSYYTPQSIVDEMVARALETAIMSEKLKRRQALKVLEPSCGTMIFIRTLCDAVYEITDDKSYLELFLSGIITVDVQAKPLILGVLGIIYKVYDLTGLWAYSWHVRCEDALLISDLDGSMDMVIGNPPYLGEKGNRDYFRYLKDLPTIAKYYEGRMDLYYFFIHRGIEALKADGILSFITTNYFVTADSAVKLREHIRQEMVFKRLVDYSDDDVFKSARGQHNLSFILQKEVIDDSKFCDVVIAQVCKRIQAYKLYDNSGLITLINSGRDYDLLEKIAIKSDGLLSDICDVKQGIVSGADAVTNKMITSGYVSLDDDISKGTPIYVFPKSEEKPFKGPWQSFYKNSDIGSYNMSREASYDIYYVTTESQPSEAGFAYLENFKTVLERRREVQLGYRQWYELQWPRTRALFEQPKLVMPQRNRKNVFAYSELPIYGSADIYYIIHKNQDKRVLKYLTALLNSKLYYYWLYKRGKKKGELLELYSTPIKSLPVIHYQDELWQRQLIAYIDEILDGGFLEETLVKSYREKIDLLVYEGFSLVNDEIRLIEKLYDKI